MERLSIDTLRGKQSVRVTFNLAPEAIDLLSVMASQLGIKQKTLFDQLIEQQELRTHLSQAGLDKKHSTEERRQKTFVLSQETLATLNLLAEKYQASRNVLVEMSIRRLLPILAIEQEKHAKRKLLLSTMRQHQAQERDLRQQAEKLLGLDDPVVQELERAGQSWQESYERVLTIIDKGKGMEKL